MRKELVDLIHEAMEQHEPARDFYHRLAHRVSHAETREMFEYLAKEAEENKDRLHHCLTPEGCPVVPAVHELHLAEHLKVPEVTEGLSRRKPWRWPSSAPKGSAGFTNPYSISNRRARSGAALNIWSGRSRATRKNWKIFTIR